MFSSTGAIANEVNKAKLRNVVSLLIRKAERDLTSKKLFGSNHYSNTLCIKLKYQLTKEEPRISTPAIERLNECFTSIAKPNFSSKRPKI